jgi:cytochrome P450
MKTFLFAGHDTTSTTVAYGYLMLSLHPEALAKARAELDTVFGTDSSKIGELMKANLNLTNNLPFILAVLKETFGHFPPSVSEGKGIISYKGVTYDINGYMVKVIKYSIHRNPDYFPSLNEFIPERFLPCLDNF